MSGAANEIKQKICTIAIAGQPNTGKSTIFNRLTGAKQHVGNWPGKTVEKKEGSFKYNGASYKLIDLPGTYSLTANSLEEIIARDFIIKEQPDILVVVVDASQLERTLYLLTETVMLQKKVIVALNMMDVAQKEGRELLPDVMEKAMGVKVIPMIASKKKGIPELLDAINSYANNGKPDGSPGEDIIKGDILSILQGIENKIRGQVPSPYQEDWTALKLLEGDKEITEIMRNSLEPIIGNAIEKTIQENSPLIVADSRYKWIQKILSSAVKRPDREKTLAMRSKFDRAATHPVWGKLVAVGIIIVALIASMIIGFPLSMGIMSSLLPMAIGGANTLLASVPLWLNSMLTDGIIVGVGVATAMFVFLMAVFIVIGFLEDVGYMPRLAYVFDRSMQRMGLHGKSFMPFMMSLTCNIAGILGARVIDSWRQRLITIIMGPIVPCMAMWGVVGFVGVLFFGVKAPLVVAALLIVMVLHLFLTSFLLRHVVIKGERTGLIMDLPPYHKPNLKTIWGYAWTHGKAFLKRGFTLIALVSFFVWLLSYLPNGNIETSFLASTGKFLNPIGKLMGFDWRLMVALAAAVASKEAALASLAIIYGIGQGVTSITGMIVTSGIYEHTALGSILTQTIAPAAALAFIFAFFFSIPCLGTVGVLYSETKSLKWTIGAAVYYSLSSLIAGILAYNVGLLIF